jgi:predicted double-glycine peptidase
MRLDTDPFPANVNMINFEEKRILVHTTQADTMKGKNVIVSDEPRVRMLKPRIPEPGVWTVNQCRWSSHRVKLTSECCWKNMQDNNKGMFSRHWVGSKQSRSPDSDVAHEQQVWRMIGRLS